MVNFAYVDPGSGQLIWQLVLSTVVGLFFYFRKLRELLCNAARKLFR